MGVRLFSPRVGAQTRGDRMRLGRGREAAALVLLTLALYLALGLFSLELTSVGGLSERGNWVGPVGAWVARALVASFGFTAWLLPIEIALMVAPLLRDPAEPQPLGMRFATDLTVAVIVASLTHVAFPHLFYKPGLTAGGSVGLFLGELLSSLFSTVGSFLVGGTSIGLILIARSGFSFIEWCHRVAAFLRWARLAVREGVVQLVEAVREALLARAEAAKARESERPPSAVALLPAPSEVASSKPRKRRKPRTVEAEKEESEEPELPEPVASKPKPTSSRGEAKRKELMSPPPTADIVDAPAVEVMPEESDEPDEPDEVQAPAAAVRAPASAALGPRIVDTRPHSEQRLAEVPADTEVLGSAYVLPSPDLLHPTPEDSAPIDRDRVLKLSGKLERTLADYGVTGTVEEILPGPTVTTYEVAPKAGTKVGKVAKLAGDLALGLSVSSVRIIAPIPGKGRVGFELPNHRRVPVNLRELVEDQRFEKLSEKAPLPVVMGRDIVGTPFYADLSEMPHMIVAGATGAGKSVGLNVMLCSLLFKRTPDELRLLMVDPKVVELAPFEGIPHMLLPVVTDMKQAATALKWAVNEMERRYRAFAIAGTKNIGTYNGWIDRLADGKVKMPDSADLETLASATAASAPADSKLPTRLPYIVVVVDEFADLMMQQGKEVEISVARLAQKARAAGMHVILATQRPSVDVITGMIKANFPTRVAFRVAQKIDSRTILDDQGAEYLLGRGDMLAKLNGSTVTRRVQCPFISEEEVSEITDHLRLQGTPEYHDDILKADEEDASESAATDEVMDPLFDEAVQIVGETQRCSTSWVQRKLGIGYNRAAKIVEMMEVQQMVGPPNGSKEREIFIQGH